MYHQMTRFFSAILLESHLKVFFQQFQWCEFQNCISTSIASFEISATFVPIFDISFLNFVLLPILWFKSMNSINILFRIFIYVKVLIFWNQLKQFHKWKEITFCWNVQMTIICNYTECYKFWIALEHIFHIDNFLFRTIWFPFDFTRHHITTPTKLQQNGNTLTPFKTVRCTKIACTCQDCTEKKIEHHHNFLNKFC